MAPTTSSQASSGSITDSSNMASSYVSVDRPKRKAPPSSSSRSASTHSSAPTTVSTGSQAASSSHSSFENATSPVPFTSITIRSTFWSPRIMTTSTATLLEMQEQMKKTGRWDAMKMKWRPGKDHKPHHFWDSDMAKWLEAACYALAAPSVKPSNASSAAHSRTHQKINQLVTEAVELIKSAQHRDGYLNTYYTVVEPGKRFTNLRDMHELYCAGHLLEAALAHSTYTNTNSLLDPLLNYINLIRKFFDSNPTNTNLKTKGGYPGHQEIELALLRSFEVTGREADKELARSFIEMRGIRDEKGLNYFDKEAVARGEQPVTAESRPWAPKPNVYAYQQAHQPIREQTSIEGHSVRAMYWLTGVTHLARLDSDEELLKSAKLLWQSTLSKIYVTGGVGGVGKWEGFGPRHFLPNENAYQETCASIGLVYFAHQLLLTNPYQTEYADVLELALLNAVMAGISLDGKAFFYENPLATIGSLYGRSRWFDCSCCPPNVARLLNSLGSYIYSVGTAPASSMTSSFENLGEDLIFVHLYIASTAEVELSCGDVVTVVQEDTDWPWEGKVRFRIEGSQTSRGRVRLVLRIPEWAQNSHYEVHDAQGRPLPLPTQASSTIITPSNYFVNSSALTLTISFTPRLLHPHPLDSCNFRHVSIARGPLVYAIESRDNPHISDIRSIRIPRHGVRADRLDIIAYRDSKAFKGLNGLTAPFVPIMLRIKALQLVEVIPGEEENGEDADVPDMDSADAEELEAETMGGRFKLRSVEVVMVPYFAWANRGPSDVRVWIPRE